MDAVRGSEISSFSPASFSNLRPTAKYRTMFKAIRSPAIAVVVSTATLRPGAPKPRGPALRCARFLARRKFLAEGLSE